MQKSKYMFSSIISFLILLISMNTYGYQVSSGTLKTIENFPSKHIAPRNVHIWLPDGYQENVDKGVKYAVLYMHDGQMLFDAKKAWNNQEWGVDEVAGKLIKTGKTRPFIVVGVDNGGHRRHSEYFPQKPFESLSQDTQTFLYSANRGDGSSLFKNEKVQSDKYLKFLVEELKPYVDSSYQVLSGPQNTAVMGSSMGGLISMYAISEYPQVFSKAACLSTHWPGSFTMENNPIPDAFFAYMNKHLPNPESHKLYFDLGTATLDAMYPPLQKKADKIIGAKGYNADNWKTLVFEGAAHTEDAWRDRLDIPLTFLFGVAGH